VPILIKPAAQRRIVGQCPGDVVLGRFGDPDPVNLHAEEAHNPAHEGRLSRLSFAMREQNWHTFVFSEYVFGKDCRYHPPYPDISFITTDSLFQPVSQLY